MVEQTRKALSWYEKAKPYLDRPTGKKANVEVVKPLRGKGVDVRFKEQAPLPDFLIRTAKIGLVLSVGNIGGQIRNITPDQPILGQPMTFAFRGDKLDGLKAMTMDGEVNFGQGAVRCRVEAIHGATGQPGQSTQIRYCGQGRTIAGWTEGTIRRLTGARQGTHDPSSGSHGHRQEWENPAFRPELGRQRRF